MIPVGTPVDVYWNLHKRCYSVRARTGPELGKVIAHADNIAISSAEFIVHRSGRLRVLRERRKNVHAIIRGRWELPTAHIGEPVTYDPYKHDAFVTSADEKPVRSADLVVGSVNGRRAVLTAVAVRARIELATSALTVRRSAN